MAAIRDRFVDDAVARDKYSSLHLHLLSVRPEPGWLTSFGELEATIGYRVSDPTQPRRPLWFGSRVGLDRSQSLTRQVGWHARAVGVEEEALVFVRGEGSLASAGTPARRRFSIRETLPPHDPGPWPEDFTVSREQIYDNMGRVTGGSENASDDDH